MFDYYLTYFGEDTSVIYRVCRTTNRITYSPLLELDTYGWESSCCRLAQLESSSDGFVRLR